MTLLRPCLECGTPSGLNYCPTHKLPDEPKASAQDRGYDTAWRNLSERARRLQPFCTDCGTKTDLQADHTPTAWRRKSEGKAIRLQDIAVVCGPCNRARGAARPDARGQGPRSRGPDPEDKAKFLLHTVTHTPGER